MNQRKSRLAGLVAAYAFDETSGYTVADVLRQQQYRDARLERHQDRPGPVLAARCSLQW